MENESQYKEWISIVFGGLLFISEVLPYVSKIKSNGILQLASNTFSKLGKKSAYQAINNEEDQESQEISQRNITETLIEMDRNELNNVTNNKLDKILEILHKLEKTNQLNTNAQTPLVQYINNYSCSSKPITDKVIKNEL